MNLPNLANGEVGKICSDSTRLQHYFLVIEQCLNFESCLNSLLIGNDPCGFKD